MPLPLYLLAVAVFAMGTSEFMLAGLLPDIAADLGVPVGTAGLLTSAFALGMVAGAPLMAAAARTWPRRSALFAFVCLFLAAHAVGAVTGSFPVLVVTRVVAALANAGFLAVALATAAALTPDDRKGRALAVLLSGTTAATIAGVPGGAILGTLLGWRATFWAVAVLCLPAAIGVLRGLPSHTERSDVPDEQGASDEPSVPGEPSVPDEPNAPDGQGASDKQGALDDEQGAFDEQGASDEQGALDEQGAPDGPALQVELAQLRRLRLILVMLLGALVNAATFGTFTFLAPIVTGTAGLAEIWVSAVLVLFGLGSFVGVTTAGRLSDKHPGLVIRVGGPLLLLGWLAVGAFAANPVALLGLVFVQGALSFALGSTLIARVLYEASGAPTMGGSYATAALNVGAVAGPLVAAATLDTRLADLGPVWVSGLLVATALLLALPFRRVLAS